MSLSLTRVDAWSVAKVTFMLSIAVAIIQVVPTQQGVQMMMLPYGYPFEQEFKGSISGEHFMYEYKKLPDDLETKYLEACTNLTLSTGGLAGAAGKSPLIK